MNTISAILLAIPYPQIDPVLIQLGPFAIRWYALAYIAGLVIGWQVMRRVCAEPPKILSPLKIDEVERVMDGIARLGSERPANFDRLVMPLAKRY